MGGWEGGGQGAGSRSLASCELINFLILAFRCNFWCPRRNQNFDDKANKHLEWWDKDGNESEVTLRCVRFVLCCCCRVVFRGGGSFGRIRALAFSHGLCPPLCPPFHMVCARAAGVCFRDLLSFTSGLMEDPLSFCLLGFEDCAKELYKAAKKNRRKWEKPGTTFQYLSGHLQFAGAMVTTAFFLLLSNLAGAS